MALDAIIVTYTANTGTGDQTLAGAGFTPKCAIVWWSRATNTVDTFEEGSSCGMGFTDGTNMRCMNQVVEDAQATSDTAYIDSDDALINTLNLTGTLTTEDGLATFSSFNSDGMVINWSDAPAAAFKFHVLYLGGDDITNVGVGSFNLALSATSQDVTTVGFQPDFVMFLPARDESPNSGHTNSIFGVSAAISSTEEWVQGIASETGRVTMDTWQFYNHAACIGWLIPSTGGIDALADFTSFLSNGFRINVTNGATNLASEVFYLAIKGGAFAVGNDTEPGSTGNQTVTTGKDCKAVMIFGVDTGTPTTNQVDCMFTMGAGTSSSNMATVVVHDLDGAADTTAVSRYETDSIYLNITANATAGSSTVDDEASLSSVSSTGFTLNWSNIGNARPFRYITFGSTAVAAEAVEEEVYQSYGNIHEHFSYR